MAQGRKGSKRRSTGDDRRYTVRGSRRDPVDMTKLSKALIGLVLAEAERQAQAEHAAKAGENTESEAASDDTPPSGGEGHD
jgi:hypothetical protein